MKKTLSYLGATAMTLGLFTCSALGEEPGGMIQPKTLGQGLLAALIFAILGMCVVFAAVIIFDKATPRIDIQKELLGNNTAVAIVTAAIVIGVSIIVAASIM